MANYELLVYLHRKTRPRLSYEDITKFAFPFRQRHRCWYSIDKISG